MPPHNRLSAMHTVALFASPMVGINQKAAASTPSTAPNVLLAYSAAMDRPSRCIAAVRRSIAGNVAPIAAVAGKNIKNVPQNATNQCQPGDGSTPITFDSPPLNGDPTKSTKRPHIATTSSHPAYHRTGCALRSIREPSASAPSASPPKNAVTTASTAADS